MKIYIATKMNGKAIDDIKRTIDDYASKLISKGYEVHNPFFEDVAKDNAVDGIVKDYKPIEMVCDSARNIEKCDGVTFVGSYDDLISSRGCKTELVIAKLYDKRVKLYNPETGHHRCVHLDISIY